MQISLINTLLYQKNIEKEINKDLDKLEIKPLYEGILIKPYAENPFQQIKKEEQ